MRVTTLGGDPSVPLREAGNAAAAADKKRLPSGVTLAELADEYRGGTTSALTWRAATWAAWESVLQPSISHTGG